MLSVAVVLYAALALARAQEDDLWCDTEPTDAEREAAGKGQAYRVIVISCHID